MRLGKVVLGLLVGLSISTGVVTAQSNKVIKFNNISIDLGDEAQLGLVDHFNFLKVGAEVLVNDKVYVIDSKKLGDDTAATGRLIAVKYKDLASKKDAIVVLAPK